MDISALINYFINNRNIDEAIKQTFNNGWKVEILAETGNRMVLLC